MRFEMRLRVFALIAGCWTALGQAQVQAYGQAAKAGSDWHHVMALPLATNIDVRSSNTHLHCKLTEVTDERLVCSRGTTSSSFARSEVRSIKIDHRGRSALIGGAIGGGALGITVFAATSNSGDHFFGPNFLRGQATGVGLAAGAVIGGGIGALTDFSKSTVYKAP